jgi:hypothetical protein
VTDSPDRALARFGPIFSDSAKPVFNTATHSFLACSQAISTTSPSFRVSFERDNISRSIALEPIYDRFNEGFENSDLVVAQAPLNEEC